MLIFYLILLIGIHLYVKLPSSTIFVFYLKCCFLGSGLGFWSQLLIVSAEQFGTNIRATAATSIPNIARAWAVPIVLVFKKIAVNIGVANSAYYLGLLTLVISALSVLSLKETFNRDLNFNE